MDFLVRAVTRIISQKDKKTIRNKQSQLLAVTSLGKGICFLSCSEGDSQIRSSVVTLGENMERVARIQQSIPGMIDPANFCLGIIRKAIILFVEYFDRVLDLGERVYPEGGGYLVKLSLEKFCSALFNAGLLGWWVTGIFAFRSAEGGYVFSTVDYDPSAPWCNADDLDTLDARSISLHS